MQAKDRFGAHHARVRSPSMTQSEQEAINELKSKDSIKNGFGGPDEDEDEFMENPRGKRTQKRRKRSFERNRPK